jgi:cation diffusion facilitator CzcD-associated flavoprotein CzcO
MPQEGAPARQRDVVVVGAGPYGLSTAVYLQERRLSLAVFGKPLRLWRGHMTQGTLLRSNWWAKNPPTCTTRQWIGGNHEKVASSDAAEFTSIGRKYA